MKKIAVITLSLMIICGALYLFTGCYTEVFTAGGTTDYGSVEYECRASAGKCKITNVKIYIDEPIKDFIFEFPTELYSTSHGKSLPVSSIVGVTGGKPPETVTVVLASEPHKDASITFNIGMNDIDGTIFVKTTDRAGNEIVGIKYLYTADENNENVGVIEGGTQYYKKVERSISVTNGEDLLIEAIPKKAKPGKRIEIRTRRIIDADVVVYVNGEKANNFHADSDFWGFEFIMPNNNVEIRIEIEGGM